MLRTLMISLVAAFVSAGAAQAAGVVIVHHTVKDYAKWLPAFEGDKAGQEAAGLTNPRIYHAEGKPNDVTIVFDMADYAKAKAFAASKALRATMTKAGVTGKPSISFLETP